MPTLLNAPFRAGAAAVVAGPVVGGAVVGGAVVALDNAPELHAASPTGNTRASRTTHRYRARMTHPLPSRLLSLAPPRSAVPGPGVLARSWASRDWLRILPGINSGMRSVARPGRHIHLILRRHPKALGLPRAASYFPA